MLRGWQEGWVRAESLLGLCATFVVGYVPPVILFFLTAVAFEAGQRWLGGLAVVGTLAAVFVAGWVTRMAATAFYQCYPDFRPSEPDRFFLSRILKSSRPPDDSISPGTPLAVAMAARLPRMPWPIRPCLSVWWLAHFAGGVVVGLGAYRLVEGAFGGAPIGARVLLILLSLVIHVGILFAMNLYLMLAVAVVLRDPKIRQKLWDRRIMIDLGFTLVVLWFGIHG